MTNTVPHRRCRTKSVIPCRSAAAGNSSRGDTTRMSNVPRRKANGRREQPGCASPRGVAPMQWNRSRAASARAQIGVMSAGSARTRRDAFWFADRCSHFSRSGHPGGSGRLRPSNSAVPGHDPAGSRHPRGATPPPPPSNDTVHRRVSICAQKSAIIQCVQRFLRPRPITYQTHHKFDDADVRWLTYTRTAGHPVRPTC